MLLKAADTGGWFGDTRYGRTQSVIAEGARSHIFFSERWARLGPTWEHGLRGRLSRAYVVSWARYLTSPYVQGMRGGYDGFTTLKQLMIDAWYSRGWLGVYRRALGRHIRKNLGPDHKFRTELKFIPHNLRLGKMVRTWRTLRGACGTRRPAAKRGLVALDYVFMLWVWGG